MIPTFDSHFFGSNENLLILTRWARFSLCSMNSEKQKTITRTQLYNGKYIFGDIRYVQNNILGNRKFSEILLGAPKTWRADTPYGVFCENRGNRENRPLIPVILTILTLGNIYGAITRELIRKRRLPPGSGCKSLKLSGFESQLFGHFETLASLKCGPRVSKCSKNIEPKDAINRTCVGECMKSFCVFGLRPNNIRNIIYKPRILLGAPKTWRADTPYGVFLETLETLETLGKSLKSLKSLNFRNIRGAITRELFKNGARIGLRLMDFTQHTRSSAPFLVQIMTVIGGNMLKTYIAYVPGKPKPIEFPAHSQLDARWRLRTLLNCQRHLPDHTRIILHPNERTQLCQTSR